MPRTLEQIKKDFLSFKKLTKTTPGATIFVEKYLEDVGALLQMATPPMVKATNGSAESEDTRPETRKSKAKAPKA